MKEQVDYAKILGCTNKAFVVDVGRCLDKFQYKWFNEANEL